MDIVYTVASPQCQTKLRHDALRNNKMCLQYNGVSPVVSTVRDISAAGQEGSDLSLSRFGGINTSGPREKNQFILPVFGCYRTGNPGFLKLFQSATQIK